MDEEEFRRKLTEADKQRKMDRVMVAAQIAVVAFFLMFIAQIFGSSGASCVFGGIGVISGMYAVFEYFT